MKLVELAPKWVTIDGQPDSERVAIIFACPVHAPLGLTEKGRSKCALAEVYVPFGGDGARWQKSGDSFENLTLTPSVLCTTVTKEAFARITREEWYAEGEEAPRCTHWHGFVTSGEVQILPDSEAA